MIFDVVDGSVVSVVVVIIIVEVVYNSVIVLGEMEELTVTEKILRYLYYLVTQNFLCCNSQNDTLIDYVLTNSGRPCCGL